MTLTNEKHIFTNSYEWLTAVYSSSKNSAQNFSHPGFSSLENLINYKFKNKNLLKSSLTHTSFVFENQQVELESYEKLEFLGDSILNFIISEAIYKKFDSLNEGDLSKLRGALVNEQVFFELANFLNLNQHILIGKGEFKNKGNEKKSILADVFESLFGAIFLDSDLETTKYVFINVIEKFEATERSFFDISSLNNFDDKSRLQEFLMRELKITPQYESVVKEDLFLITLKINEDLKFQETGKNKKEIEKILAKKALEYLKKKGDENVTN